MASAADWEEIKRLAADLQKAQLSTSAQKLSEKNVIDLVAKLVELKLIEVIYTSDGKEYVTPQHLIKEIKDELYVHGGRINTVDLAKELNVDLSHINNGVSEIVKSKEVQLISGHLVSNSYFEKIAGEINEKLQQQGQINVGDLTMQYDLPADFLLHNVLERFLGKVILGRQDTSDPKIFYTENFITRSKAKIKGALMGLIKPTPVAVIINHCNLTDRLFSSLFDQMKAPGSLTGRQAGAMYVPYCYTKAQTDWVQSFYNQNYYLEYDALTRLGISDPKTFAKRCLQNENVLFLKSCLVGPQIKEQVENALDECIASKSYVDIVTLLPSICSDADIETLLESLLKTNSKSTVSFENTVFSNHYLESLRELCMPMVRKNAEQAVKSGKYQQFYFEKLLSKTMDAPQGHVDYKTERRDERRKKAATGKGGGGTQGRETKTKAVKKHARPSKYVTQESDSEDDSGKKKEETLVLVTLDEIESLLKNVLEKEGLDDLITPVSEYLLEGLTQTALQLAKEESDKLLQNASQNRKQTHSAVQEKINILINSIKLYEKGIKLLPSEHHQQFIKYLLKTIGGDVLSEFLKYAATQSNLQLSDDNITVEQKVKVLNDLPNEYAKPLKALNGSLSDQNMEAFYQAVDVALQECGMILKKVDKKKDRIIVHNHREELVASLDGLEPALLLHAAALAMFTGVTQAMLHASGRQVPVILAYLAPHLPDDQRELLNCYYELVTKYLTAPEEEKPELEMQLQSEMPKIKDLVRSMKK